MLRHLIDKFFLYSDSIIFHIGISAISSSRNLYKSFTRLSQADLKVFSQYGEDGILDFLCVSLGIDNPTFIEIGTEDYSESNTRFIFQRCSAKGLVIDCDPNLSKKVSSILGDFFWKGDLSIISEFVTRENICELLYNYDVNWHSFDLFSLDIDGIDYWVMSSIIESIDHKIVVLEYNPYFGSELCVSVPYNPAFDRTNYHFSNLCWGASLRAFVNLMSNHGYTFVGSNLNNQNGFWVRNDLLQNLSIDIPTEASLYKYTINYTRESRNRDGSLSLLSGYDRLNQIRECQVIDIQHDNKLVKLTSLLDN